MARARAKRAIGVRLPPRIPASLTVRHPTWLERCTCGHIAAHHSHGKANRQAAVDTNGLGGCLRCDCRKATYPPNGDRP